jgi:hypothetical protein
MELYQAPAFIFQSNQNLAVNHLTKCLRQAFCKQFETYADCSCAECEKILAQQHPSIIWITPEKNYTTKDIAVIFEKIRFSLDEDHHFFFILYKVETLPAVCANRLLKVIEEPPPRYHFLLQTCNVRNVLPTIVSRCLIFQLTSSDDNQDLDPLLSFFTNPQLLDNPLEFEQALKKQQPSHIQAQELMCDLIDFFSTKLRDMHLHDTTNNVAQHDYLVRCVHYLHEKLKKPPQQGSSIIFFKNLYVSFPRNG